MSSIDLLSSINIKIILSLLISAILLILSNSNPIQIYTLQKGCALGSNNSSLSSAQTACVSLQMFSNVAWQHPSKGCVMCINCIKTNDDDSHFHCN